MPDIINDLIAEQAQVDCIISDLKEDQWNTPLVGEETWRIKDTINHIAIYDYAACAMLNATEENARIAVEKEGGVDEYKRSIKYRDISGAEALDWWRKMRTEMDYLFIKKNMKDRVNWAPGVPPMSVRALCTARQMELWAHSVDICNTLGLPVIVTDRIKNTLFLSWQARANAYRINGLTMPDVPIYLELTLPSGELWTNGVEKGENYIIVSAKDWALVSVRRINWRDTDLVIRGTAAEEYADIVQTYAGDAEKAPLATRKQA